MKRTQLDCHHDSFDRNRLTQFEPFSQTKEFLSPKLSPSIVWRKFQTVLSLSTESPTAVRNLADFLIIFYNTLASPLLWNLVSQRLVLPPGCFRELLK